MTIKTKLTLNAVIVLAIIVAVAATSLIGMGFIKARLSDLTERSTPFQMRTVEFQRAIQGVTADLTKVSVALNSDELAAYKAEAAKSLNEVNVTQTAIEELSGGAKNETYDELKKIADEIIQVTEERLKAEAEAKTSHATVAQGLNESESKLKDVDSRVQALQTGKSTAVMSSMSDTSAISSKVRNIESLRSLLKDVQISLFELGRAQDKKAVIIARGKLNALIAKLNQEEALRENQKLGADIKAFTGKIEELIRLRMSSDADAKNSLEAITRDVDERLSVFVLSFEQEAIAARERSNVETEKQGTLLTQSGVSTSLLVSNSQLVALGTSVEARATKLFTVRAVKEVDAIEAELKKIFEKIDAVVKTMNKGLLKLDSHDAVKVLKSSENSLIAIRNILLSKDGVAAKIRNELAMRQKAFEATGKLREIVLKQAEKNKKTVSAAKGEQEKAIGTVNKMVRFSSLLIAVISVGSIVFGIFFGIWVYHSISGPLAQLMKVSDEVSNGNLAYAIPKSSSDEIGIVQTSMAKMVANLKEIVGKITVSTSQLASSSEELSATAVVIDNGSREQTSQVEQSATAMTEMSQTTLDVAKNASATSESATKMKGLAEHGKQAMGVTVQELVKFSGTFKQAADKIEALSRQSQEISNVVSLIREIAEQTNLLALNAAIEAAHAGDQGRGFAVVADNVRQLAERTAGATDDIGRTIRKMQTDVDDTVTFVKHEKEAVESVVRQVKLTMGEIDQITGNVEQVADMIQRIAVATDEQSSTSDMVSQSMESVANVTRQLSASIEEIKRSAGDLSKLAAELSSMTGWFKT
ncbi:MAG: HAMP domain-containing protein [Nitrospirae bacterium]|nr:HAMP domain-containing protein [Nitrospirota bacterium]